MIIIEASSTNSLFKTVAKQLFNNGVKSNPRGLDTLELNDVMMILNCLDDDGICHLESRNISLAYLYGEIEWYMSGSLNTIDIVKHSKFWSNLANSNGTVNSNYGFMALKEIFNGKSQFEWCLQQLKNDDATRQAVINYNQPRYKYDGNKDFPCAMYQQFRIVNKKLESFVAVRSNDFIYGLTYDLPWFIYVQKRLAKELNIECGCYKHFDNSLHVYQRHFDMLQLMAREKEQEGIVRHVGP